MNSVPRQFLTPRPYFGGRSLDPAADPLQNINEGRETFEKATTSGREHLIWEEESPKSHIRQTVDKWKSIVKKFLTPSLFLPPLVLGGGAGTLFYRAHQHQQAIESFPSLDNPNGMAADQYRIVQDHQLKSDALTRLGFFLSMTSGMIFLIPTLVSGIAIVEIARETRRAMKFGKKMVPLLRPRTEEESQVEQLLYQKIQKDLETLRTKIKKLYKSNGEAQEYLNLVFGGKQGLPDVQQLENLFDYYAYHQVLHEQGGVNRASEKPISLIDFQKKVLVLVDYALNAGELFGCLETRNGSPQEHQIDSNLLVRIADRELLVDQQIETFRTLIRQEKDLDQHLTKARQALTALNLSRLNGRKEIQQVETLIRELKNHRFKLKQVLEKGLGDLSASEALVKELNQEVEQLFRHFRAVLDVKALEAQSETLAETAARIANEESEEDLRGESPLASKLTDLFAQAQKMLGGGK